MTSLRPGRSSYETSREFKRCTAAFLTRNKKPADGLPALPCSGISFSCTSGVSLQQLSIQISRQLSSATGAAANDSFSASEKDTDTPTLPHDLRVSTQPRTSKDEVLSALEAVKRSADSGSLYILETRLAEAFPEHAEANAKVAAIRDLAQHIEQLRQEKARLAMFRHQTPKEIRSEYIQMMLTGLFTGLAAAIHPIFFVGTIGGLIRMRRTKRAEVDRDEGTKKMEELNRTVKERRAVLKEHVDALFELLSR